MEQASQTTDKGAVRRHPKHTGAPRAPPHTWVFLKFPTHSQPGWGGRRWWQLRSRGLRAPPAPGPLHVCALGAAAGGRKGVEWFHPSTPRSQPAPPLHLFCSSLWYFFFRTSFFTDCGTSGTNQAAMSLMHKATCWGRQRGEVRRAAQGRQGSESCPTPGSLPC